MGKTKIAITLDEKVVKKVDGLVKKHVYPNRSRAIQDALQDKLEKIEHRRLAREWADLDPAKGHEQAGHRPVLILSHDVFNERSGTVIAMAITSKAQRAGFPLTLELTNSKLPKQSWLKISQIRTLSTERIWSASMPR